MLVTPHSQIEVSKSHVPGSRRLGKSVGTSMMKEPRLRFSKLSASQHLKHISHVRDRLVATELKALQRSKIRELRDALLNAGLVTLDAQADALGLSRSTTWAILKANHKASGLSAAIINRMLESPRLPLAARATILEYIEEKTAGCYGASTTQQRRFSARVYGARPEGHQDLAITQIEEKRARVSGQQSRRGS